MNGNYFALGATPVFASLEVQFQSGHSGGVMFQAESGCYFRYSRARGATSHSPVQALRLVKHAPFKSRAA